MKEQDPHSINIGVGKGVPPGAIVVAHEDMTVAFEDDGTNAGDLFAIGIAKSLAKDEEPYIVFNPGDIEDNEEE